MPKPATDLLRFEREHQNQYQRIAGLDEAGRGCWAGPVVAAAVILPADTAAFAGINDSKQLSAKQRERCFDVILKNAVAFGIGLVDSQIIDEINILEASKRAMLLALQQIQPQADFLLIDGNMRLQTPIPQKAIVDGDALSLSIASASILAKVTRDRLMVKCAGQYPNYGFEKHKGYGTAIHREALQNWGITPIHRRSYKPVAVLLNRT